MAMQRHAILMYTSCGWFFDEISGIETNQILQYALRAMDYAQDLGLGSFHDAFEQKLSLAPSNVFTNGAESYKYHVVPTRVTLGRVAMHFAVASLFEDDPEGLDLFNYTASVGFFEKIEAGTPQLAGGRLHIRSKITGYERDFCFAVLYLGQQHIIGNISETMNASTFEDMWTLTSAAFRSANMGEVIGALQQYFGPAKFTLSSLFKDERSKIIREITESGMLVAEGNFKNVFNDNYQLMSGLQAERLQIPDTWRNVAAYVLNTELLDFFMFKETIDPRKLRRIAEDIRRWQIKLIDVEAVQLAVSNRIYSEINNLNMEVTSLARVHWLNEVIQVIQTQTDLKPDIWRSQNVFYLFTKGFRKGQWVFANEEWKKAFELLAELLKVRLS
jgi:hypothetical protein